MVYNQVFVLRNLRKFSVLLAGLGLGSVAALNTSPSWAQSDTSANKPVRVGQVENVTRERANIGTVTLMTGGIDGVSSTYYQLASDMATVLDVRSELRILPMIGYGSLQNIEDLLYLKGIDFSMVHSDVLRHMEQKNVMPGAKRKLRYVTKLYDEPLHILANTKYTDISQLNGKTVIVGRPGSGNEMSALTLITDLGLDVNLVHVEFAEGVEQVRRGEAAAMVVVTRSPSKKLQKVEAGSELHFLSVPMTKTVLRTYEPQPLTSEDYPNLIKPGTEIVVPQMSAVLAVYNWKQGGARYNNVTNFIASFAGNLEKLTKARRSDIWGKLDVVGEVKGWERFQPAVTFVQEVVAARAQATASASAVEEQNSEFAQFAKYIRLTTKKEMSDEALKGLFERYKAWGDRQANQTAQ